MTHATSAPLPKKTAYKRPYKSRSQRREAERQNHDENNDYKFLLRVGFAIGLVVLITMAIVVKGMMDGNSAAAPTEVIR